MKIAVIGGGSSYTPELINGFLDRVEALPISELCLMDISPERLEVVGGFAQRMVQAKGGPFAVRLTTHQPEAIEGASYVLTQFRVGGMAARREDEYLGRRHGLIGQETTGIGGMAKALRTIPVVLNIARDLKKLASDALLINFSNPAGLVVQAVSLYEPDVPIVGVCNEPYWSKMQIVDHLNAHTHHHIDPNEAQLATLGLNHLCWYRDLSVNGESLWDDFMAALRQHPLEWHWDPATIQALQMVPNNYLTYFYYAASRLARQANWPPSRAEIVMEIEADLLAQYAEPDRTEAPEGLLKRGGAYYSTVATQLISAHYNNLDEVHVGNVPNRGAVADYPDDWVLELNCRVNREGIQPLPADPLPPAAYGLMAAVKAYEMLSAKAATTGDRTAAYQALLVHPLGPSADRIQAVLDDMLETSRPYLPQFFEE
ncbi:MAG: 6-phospho-beta-glucosidase [Chloroflexi bacterium]|nr:6-phospho-beta-glucosidase [Chloroflexota bacterium]